MHSPVELSHVGFHTKTPFPLLRFAFIVIPVFLTLQYFTDWVFRSYRPTQCLMYFVHLSDLSTRAMGKDVFRSLRSTLVAETVRWIVQLKFVRVSAKFSLSGRNCEIIVNLSLPPLCLDLEVRDQSMAGFRRFPSLLPIIQWFFPFSIFHASIKGTESIIGAMPAMGVISKTQYISGLSFCKVYSFLCSAWNMVSSLLDWRCLE